jgi:amino acid permease
MPICAFAYSCHTAVLPVFYSMKNPTEKRFDRVRCRHARQRTIALTALAKVRTRSYLFVTVLYFVSGLFGYLFFRDNAGARKPSSFLASSLSRCACLSNCVSRSPRRRQHPEELRARVA